MRGAPLFPAAQVVLHRILAEWGDEGLERHVLGVQAVFWRRASSLYQAALQARPQGLGFSDSPPNAAASRPAPWIRPQMAAPLRGRAPGLGYLNPRPGTAHL